MKKENLYEPFSVSFETLDKGGVWAHKNSFFELIYVLSGTGQQCINQHKFDYHPDHMFLITPDDCHSLDIKTSSQFFFLRFNDIYIRSKGISSADLQRLEFILHNANHQPGCILKNQPDKSLVRPVIEAVIREYLNRDLYNKELVQQLVNTLIVVVARNIARYLPKKVSECTEEKAIGILEYIQNNIYHPEKIRTEMVSKHFGISETYLGRYFKKHMNETLQQYTTNYRTRFIVNRLQHSDMRINEIADELGFTDESHLNKFFKKQKGLSPGQYRKSFKEPLC